ncbi:hypothetical protein R3P38DRAFT_2840283 [Favolaschia claudopus]|uniref:RNA polymerase II elongation factor ELL N-terminal domain-containing protein n=1 Tax=Favolaschia claudopus TaxID=2862362 RepID=A0AAW0E2E6_9AGAR
MSLPTNVKLSVQGHSRPGDISQSAPKKAMIVRMTAETLDALQANPHMRFTFDSEPGILIGEEFFPMRPAKENCPHDLYLRASSASKPMAPLKLHANITGKFVVERNLVNVQDKIRSTTRAAEDKKHSRTITFLEAPPPGVSSKNVKRRPGPGKATAAAFLKPIAHPRPSASTSARPLSPLPSANVTPSLLRTAVIKALAVKGPKGRSFDDLVRLPAVEGDRDGRRKLTELLSQIAEHPKGARSASQWCLKPDIWVEVRPYEWNDLTEQENIQIARWARLTFSNLNIPESDPVWTHVQYRHSVEGSMLGPGSASGASPALRAAGKPDAPKRGVSSKEAKEKKVKPKPDPRAEISARDESKAVPRVSNAGAIYEQDLPVQGPSTSHALPVRRGPGSGYKVSTKVPSPTNPPPPASVPTPTPTPNPIPRGRPVDVRTNREAPRASLPAKPAPPIPPPMPEKEKKPAAQTRIKKIKDAGQQAKPSGAVAESRDRDPDVARQEPLKRRRPQDIDDSDATSGSIVKRRKTDGVVQQTSVVRDSSLPKRPDTSLPSSRSLPSKIKRESSPLPPARPPQKVKSDPSAPLRSSLPARVATVSNPATVRGHTESLPNSKNSNQRHHSSSSASKRRERPSPVYTSSEDEGEIRNERVPLPKPSTTTVPPPNRSRSSHSSNSSQSLPKDRNGLRKKYNATYLKYLTSYHKLFAQQSKLESLLSRDGSIVSDSDGDVELLSAEDTMKLKAEHKRHEQELENIRAMFAMAERSEPRSD